MGIKPFMVAMVAISLFNTHSAQAAQRCKANKPATAPTSDFSIDKSKGLVTQGNLMWKMCSEGQTLGSKGCDGNPKGVYFEDITKPGKRFSYAGYSDWRVPTIDELKGIVEKQCRGPAMNPEVFPDSPNLMLWSQSMVQGKNDKVWGLYSSTGVPIKSSIYITSMLRLVRDTK